MLKLSKRKDSPVWYARGTHLGVGIDRSLGTRDRKEAEALLAKLQHEIFEDRARGPVPEVRSFAEAALTYMQSGGERRFLAPLLRHFGDTKLDQIDAAAVTRAALAILPAAAPATRNRQVFTPTSAILRSAGIVLTLHRPKQPAGVVRWLTHEEAARLLEACSAYLRPLVLFMLYTGARVGEALWLDWSCVDLGRAHVSFPKTKNGEPRGVPLHRDLVAELASLPHRDGCVFRRPDGQPYTRPEGEVDSSAGSRIKTAFQAACRRAGITNFRVHDCRHTWASWHYAAHHDLVTLQRLGGWKTLAMVTRYAHQNSERDRDSVEALPSFCENSVKSNSRKRVIA